MPFDGWLFCPRAGALSIVHDIRSFAFEYMISNQAQQSHTNSNFSRSMISVALRFIGSDGIY